MLFLMMCIWKRNEHTFKLIQMGCETLKNILNRVMWLSWHPLTITHFKNTFRNRNEYQKFYQEEYNSVTGTCISIIKRAKAKSQIRLATCFLKATQDSLKSFLVKNITIKNYKFINSIRCVGKCTISPLL